MKIKKSSKRLKLTPSKTRKIDPDSIGEKLGASKVIDVSHIDSKKSISRGMLVLQYVQQLKRLEELLNKYPSLKEAIEFTDGIQLKINQNKNPEVELNDVLYLVELLQKFKQEI